MRWSSKQLSTTQLGSQLWFIEFSNTNNPLPPPHLSREKSLELVSKSSTKCFCKKARSVACSCDSLSITSRNSRSMRDTGATLWVFLKIIPFNRRKLLKLRGDQVKEKGVSKVERIFSFNSGSASQCWWRSFKASSSPSAFSWLATKQSNSSNKLSLDFLPWSQYFVTALANIFAIRMKLVRCSFLSFFNKILRQITLPKWNNLISALPVDQILVFDSIRGTLLGAMFSTRFAHK